MNMTEAIRGIIEPTFHEILPARFDSPKARVMLLAIGWQESRFEHTHQIGGPAHGYWQFEANGGTRGVLIHPASSRYALAACVIRRVSSIASDTFDALEHDQLLACAFARLLLWTDPVPLPALGDMQGAWEYYLRLWRPGKPHFKTWAIAYESALREAMLWMRS